MSQIGPNWKEITGIGQPKQDVGSCPGYNHQEHWSSIPRRWFGDEREDVFVPPINHEKRLSTLPSYSSYFTWKLPLVTILAILALVHMNSSVEGSEEGEGGSKGGVFSRDQIIQFSLLSLLLLASHLFLRWQGSTLIGPTSRKHQGVFYASHQSCITSSDFTTATNQVLVQKEK